MNKIKESPQLSHPSNLFLNLFKSVIKPAKGLVNLIAKLVNLKKLLSILLRKLGIKSVNKRSMKSKSKGRGLKCLKR